MSELHSEKCPTCGAGLPGNLTMIDLGSNILIAGGMSLRLTPREAEVCSVLHRSNARFVTKEDLADRVYGASGDGTAEVRKIVSRLRLKIMRAGMPISIKAGYAVGYCWTQVAAPALVEVITASHGIAP